MAAKPELEPIKDGQAFQVEAMACPWSYAEFLLPDGQRLFFSSSSTNAHTLPLIGKKGVLTLHAKAVVGKHAATKQVIYNIGDGITAPAWHFAETPDHILLD